MLVALAAQATAYFAYAARVARFPFALDYGEGTVWQQARLMLGPQMASDLSHAPFIAFNYTPGYHLLVRGLMDVGADGLYAGRAISLVALVVLCVLMGLITFRGLGDHCPKSARYVGALTAALTPMTFQPVQQWAMQMRVDMLAAAFSTFGVYLAIGAGPRVISLCTAALAFVAAVYTKQTELSAPAAVLLVSAVFDLRKTLTAAIFGMLVGDLILVVLQAVTHDGFSRHAFAYNVNRFAWRHAAGQMRDRLPDAAGLVAALAAITFLWWRKSPRMAWRRVSDFRASLHGSIEVRTLATISLWLLFSTLLLTSAGKHGASSNYFVEWLCVCSLPIGLATGAICERLPAGPLGRTVAWVLPILILIQAADRPVWRSVLTEDPSAIPVRQRIVDLIRSSTKPVVSEDLSLLMRADRTAPIEPSTMTELAAVGEWNPKPFEDLIRNRTFGFFVTETPDARLTPEIFRVVQEYYPVVQTVGRFRIRRPKSS